MKIEAIGNRSTYRPLSDRQDRSVANEQVQTRKADKSTAQSAISNNLETSPSRAQATGALQNLQGAHYQGVASLQLQINFQGQLQSERNHQATAYLANSSRTMMIGVEQRVSTIGQTFGSDFGEEMVTGIGEMMDTFREKVFSFFDNDETNGNSPQSLLSSIQGAFDGFFNALSGINQGDGEEQQVADSPQESEGTETTEGTEAVAETSKTSGTTGTSEEMKETASTTSTDETAVAETVTGTTAQNQEKAESVATETGNEGVQLSSFADHLEELQDWVDGQMSIFRTTIHDLMQQPTIGNPQGNGASYGRFLAIYTEMNTITSTDETTGDGTGSTTGSQNLSTEA